MMSSPDSHPTQIVGELKVCPRLPCDILKLLLCNTWVFVVQHAECYFQVVVDILDISTTHVSSSLKGSRRLDKNLDHSRQLFATARIGPMATRPRPAGNTSTPTEVPIRFCSHRLI